MDILKEQKTKKGINTEKKIFEVAIKLINLNGYENITIKDICKEANIGVGTFYHHFKSKQELIIEYVKMESKEIIEYNNSLNNDKSTYDNLISLISYQLDYFDKKGKKFVNNIYIVALSQGLNETGFYNYSLFRIIKEYVNLLLQENIFTRNYTVDFISNLIISQIFGLSIFWISSDEKSMKEKYLKDITTTISIFKKGDSL